MNTKFWIPTLVSTVLAIGAVEAFADSGWSYDESTETVIYNYSGSPVKHTASSSEHEVVDPTGTFYYDESSETIVFNSEGSRSHYARTKPSSDTFEYDARLAFLDQ